MQVIAQSAHFEALQAAEQAESAHQLQHEKTLASKEERKEALENFQNYNVACFDMLKANLPGNKPEWKEIIRYSTEYGMADLSPESFLDLARRIRDDKATRDLFDLNTNGKLQPSSGFFGFDQVGYYCNLTSSNWLKQNECYQSGGYKVDRITKPSWFESIFSPNWYDK